MKQNQLKCRCIKHWDVAVLVPTIHRTVPDNQIQRVPGGSSNILSGGITKGGLHQPCQEPWLVDCCMCLNYRGSISLCDTVQEFQSGLTFVHRASGFKMHKNNQNWFCNKMPCRICIQLHPISKTFRNASLKRGPEIIFRQGYFRVKVPKYLMCVFF